METEAKRLSPNSLHVIAAIGRYVKDGKDASSTYHNIREEIDLDAVGMSRSQVQKEAEAAMEAYKNVTFPVEQRLWDLRHDEFKLRGDIVAELQLLDFTDAGVVREVHKTVSAMMASSGSPSLVEGLDLLDEYGVDTTAYKARLSALGFPELDRDDDEQPVLDRPVP